MKLLKSILFILFCFFTSLPLGAKGGPVPPQKMEIPFETSWSTMQELLASNQLRIISENRGQGYIKTSYKEFASGLLTQSHLEKIGLDTDVSDGSYEKVEYQYEIEIRLVSKKTTLMTVDANIRAYHRNFLGEEKWVPIKSNGHREEFLLNSFGKILWGEEWEMEYTTKRRGKKKYVLPSDLNERVASPERP
jgi:hypothetical protein